MHHIREVENSPASFCSVLQVTAISVDSAVPSTRQSLPLPPVHLRYRHPLFPKRYLLYIISLRHAPPHKRRQPARVGLEILHADVLWHIPRQGPPYRNQTRRMSTDKHRFRAPLLFIQIRDDAQHRVCTPIMQFFQRLATRGRNNRRLIRRRIRGKEPPHQFRTPRRRMIEARDAIPFPSRSKPPISIRAFH